MGTGTGGVGEAGLLCCALLVRLLLLAQGAHEWLGLRIELGTPVNQWQRVKEGIALLDFGLSPYSGDLFHETPLALVLFRSLLGLGEWSVGLFFVAVDFLVALCLAKTGALWQKQEVCMQNTERKSFGKGVDGILVKEDSHLPLFVAMVYLLNPYTVLTCGSYSTITLSNLAIAFAVWMQLRGSPVLSSLGLALASYLSLYPVMLLFPFAVMAAKAGGVARLVVFSVLFFLWTGVLFVVSWQLMGSWDFVMAVHGVILTVPDQTPNLGLFWYFFTEAFEHFRVFFLCVFQINAFIYVVPLTVRFSNHPMFVVYLLLSLMALFKSYPCVGDLSLPLALLPLWSHTFRYLRYTLVVLVMFLLSSCLCPVLWYLWIHAGSANANFFFAMTLTYSLAQIFLVADVVYSFLVYQYDLKHGLPRVDKDGNPIKLKLV